MPGKARNNIIQIGKYRFKIRWELPRDPRTGQRQQKCLTVHGTRKDAERVLREKLQEVDAGNYAVPTDITVERYMLDWLEKYAAKHPVQKTHKTAEYLVKKHVINEFGFLKLSDLQPYQIDRLYTNLLKQKNLGGKGLSTRTVRYVHSLLFKALKGAITLRLISNNPAKDIEVPKLHQREVLPLMDDERNRFLSALVDTPYEPLFLTALGTGARFQELLNLRWSQINFADKTIIIINMDQDDAEKGYFTTDGKKECSKRTIPLFPSVEKALKAQRLIQAKEKLLCGPLYEENGYVFTNRVGKQLNQSNVRNRYFKPILAKAGLPLNTHFHSLRHTFISTLLRKGEDFRKVSTWAGHRKPEFTFQRYHHYIPSKVEDTESERVDNHLFG